MRRTLLLAALCACYCPPASCFVLQEGKVARARARARATPRSSARAGSARRCGGPLFAMSERAPAADLAADSATALSMGKAIEVGVNLALQGDDSVLRQVMHPSCRWSSELGKFESLEKVVTELRELGEFYSSPRLTVIREGEREIEWIASGTWPLPWVPRIIARGVSRVGLDPLGGGQVISIEDKWEQGIPALMASQLLPGFWDLWSQLVSPVAERYPKRVIRSGNGYEVWEYAPRLVLEPSVVDRTNSRDVRMAYVLPDFPFTATLRTSGKVPESYYTTSPIEITISPEIEDGEDGIKRRTNRITWSMQIPSALGLDESAMPNPVNEAEFNAAAGDRVAYFYQKRHVVAVASYNGAVQDKEAGEKRAELLEKLKNAGERIKLDPQTGRPLAGFMRFDGAAGFSKLGKLCIAIWEYRPLVLGTGNKVFVELDESE